MQTELCVLAVDDDPEILATLAEYFAAQSVPFHIASDGAEMRAVMAKEPVTVVLLDLKIPGEDGFVLCRELRALNRVGIIMLTGPVETTDRVVGIEMGADDYVAKPFELREVLARVRSVHRRIDHSGAHSIAAGDSGPEGDSADEIHFGSCVLNTATRSLKTVSGEVVTLSGLDYDLLVTLLENSGRVLSRERLLELAHGRGWDPLDRSVDVRVTRLRKKIEPLPGKPQFLRTVRGVGYIFHKDGVV